MSVDSRMQPLVSCLSIVEESTEPRFLSVLDQHCITMQQPDLPPFFETKFKKRNEPFKTVQCLPSVRERQLCIGSSGSVRPDLPGSSSPC